MEIKSEKKEFQPIDITLTSMREVELFLCFFNASVCEKVEFINRWKKDFKNISEFKDDEMRTIFECGSYDMLKSYYIKFGGNA